MASTSVTRLNSFICVAVNGQCFSLHVSFVLIHLMLDEIRVPFYLGIGVLKPEIFKKPQFYPHDLTNWVCSKSPLRSKFPWALCGSGVRIGPVQSMHIAPVTGSHSCIDVFHMTYSQSDVHSEMGL